MAKKWNQIELSVFSLFVEHTVALLVYQYRHMPLHSALCCL